MSVPKINFKVEGNNPIIDFFKNNNANSMFRMINQTDEFKLQKNTGAGLEDIMSVNEDGVITFPKNVEFKGSSTVINTNVVTFQDQQVDLGLTDTVNLDVSSVTQSTSGANFRYTFKLQDSNKTIPFAVNDYLLIQNLVSTATPAVSLLDSVALLVVVVSNGTSPKTFTIESSSNFNVANIANNSNVIASKISAIAANSGVRFLGLNGSSLVEGVLQFNSSNNLSLENNTGTISVGSNSVNQNINVGTAGTRTIQVGSAAATAVNLDGITFSIDSSSASNINTSAGVLTVGGAGGVAVNSTSGIINVGNETVTGAINVGTAGARTIQVGSAAATAVNLDAITFSIDSSSASNINTSAGVLTVGGAGGVAVNSTSGVINVGNDAVTGAINVGTAGARTIQVGSAAATAVNLDAITFSIDSSSASNINTSAGVLTVGGAGGVAINSTSGVINIGNETVNNAMNVGTAGARTIQVGSASATAVNLDAITFSIDSSSASNLTTSSGLLTVSGGSGVTVTSTGGQLTLNGTGQTVQLNAATYNLSSTTSNLDSTGAVSINSSGGVINIGNNSVAQDINIGTAGARTITLGSTSATAVNAYNFAVASDVMLKTNITPLSSTLDKVLQLDGYKYNWKNSDNNSTHIGLIAQEVEQQFPELVTQNNNYKSVNYLGMIAVLINAMKEQQQEIEKIRNKIN